MIKNTICFNKGLNNMILLMIINDIFDFFNFLTHRYKEKSWKVIENCYVVEK